MKVLVICGNEKEYVRWLKARGAHPLAAVRIESAAQLGQYSPEHSRIECFGTYWENPAYASLEHWSYVHELRLRATG